MIELPIPPQKQRERMVRELCAEMLPPASVRRIAAAENLAPAVLTRAMSVVQCIQAELGSECVPEAVEQLIGKTLAAQGYRPLNKADSGNLPEAYDPAFIQADSDLVEVAK